LAQNLYSKITAFFDSRRSRNKTHEKLLNLVSMIFHVFTGRRDLIGGKFDAALGEVEHGFKSHLGGFLGLGKLKDGAVNRTAGHGDKVIREGQAHLHESNIGLGIETQPLKREPRGTVSHAAKADQTDPL